MHTMDCGSGFTRKDVLTPATVGMTFKDPVLCELRQPPQDKCRVTPAA